MAIGAPVGTYYAAIAERIGAALRGEPQKFERKERDADGSERPNQSQ